MRTAVFGGTFDPPHSGHLVVASDVHQRLGVDRVLFVPASEPPHKRGASRTSDALRLEMVRAAIGDDERFEVDDVEIRRGGVSYTVETLRALRARAAEERLWFVMGADQYREFSSWREPAAIRRLATLAVLAREGVPPLEREHEGVVHVPVTRVDISATEVRRRVAAGEPIRYLVPDAVRAIIAREGLYRSDA
jgi:nicotinate-nucleotide adenylyltransferase